MNEQENKISLADYFKSANTDQSQFNYIGAMDQTAMNIEHRIE